MEPFVVVTHPARVPLEARTVEHETAPPEHVALGFYVGDHVIARGFVPNTAVEPLSRLLQRPVTLAVAATQDDQGNIDGRVCIVLPLPPESTDNASDGDEPWKTSLPDLPSGIESTEESGAVRLALLPLGNVVRSVENRHHADVASDAREMLDNLLAGNGRDAVERAIDDLLRNL